jgi:hypothetical protein
MQTITKINGITQPVTVQCVACLEEFETHPANLGYGLAYCPECSDGFELAAELSRNGGE